MVTPTRRSEGAKVMTTKVKTAGELEQDERIRENMAADLEYAIETGDLQMFEDIFEDRDPFEFL